MLATQINERHSFRISILKTDGEFSGVRAWFLNPVNKCYVIHTLKGKVILTERNFRNFFSKYFFLRIGYGNKTLF